MKVSIELPAGVEPLPNAGFKLVEVGQHRAVTALHPVLVQGEVAGQIRVVHAVAPARGGQGGRQVGVLLQKWKSSLPPL